MTEEGLPKKATFVQRPKAGNEGNYVKIWGKRVQAERTASAKVLRQKWVCRRYPV